MYYVSEMILKLGTNISGDKLVSLGTCFGKFTKAHRFQLHVTALDNLVQTKPGAEASNHLVWKPWVEIQSGSH